MSNRCEILMEDDGEHAAVRFVFPNGFDAASPCHRMANIIRNMLDREFENQAAPVEGQLPPELLG